jgi:hypothetical protein
MKKSLSILAIIFSLSLMVVEAQSAPPFHIKQTSNLFKRMGCGVNPEGCIWCSKSSSKCYIVDGCKDGWCNVWASRRNPTDPNKGIGTGRTKSPPTTVGNPRHPPRYPVKPVKPVGVSNPNQTDKSNPVILLRNNDSGSQGHGHK